MKKAISLVIVILILIATAIPAFAATQSTDVSNGESMVEVFEAKVTNMDVTVQRGAGRKYLLAYKSETHSGVIEINDEEYASFAEGDTVSLWYRTDKGKAELVREHSTSCYVTDIVRCDKKYFAVLSDGNAVRILKGDIYKVPIGADYVPYSFAKELTKDIAFGVGVVLFFLAFIVFWFWLLDRN